MILNAVEVVNIAEVLVIIALSSVIRKVGFRVTAPHLVITTLSSSLTPPPPNISAA